MQSPLDISAEIVLFYLMKLSLGFGLNKLKLETESLESKLATLTFYTTLSMKTGWI